MNQDSQSVDQSAPNWVKETEHANWQARDSQCELVYKDKLWIFGGWFNSYEAPPLDVWNSADGKDWKLITDSAPWKYSDLSMALVFKDKMWFMGGWYNGRLEGCGACSEVWSSSDGVKWQQATPQAAWSPRLAAGVVVFKDKMWILGGTENYYFGDDSSLKNDVWQSSDGSCWDLVTENAPWSPRAYHRAIVHDNKIWVIAGGSYIPNYHVNNDVWCSEDGENWEQVTEHAPWGPRIWFKSAVYQGRIWVMGGWAQDPQGNYGDVWYSKDGKNWTQLKSPTIWKSRHEHAAFVFQNKLWVAGGHARPLNNEVWSLQVAEDWLEN